MSQKSCKSWELVRTSAQFFFLKVGLWGSKNPDNYQVTTTFTQNSEQNATRHATLIYTFSIQTDFIMCRELKTFNQHLFTWILGGVFLRMKSDWVNKANDSINDFVNLEKIKCTSKRCWVPVEGARVSGILVINVMVTTVVKKKGGGLSYPPSIQLFWQPTRGSAAQYNRK